MPPISCRLNCVNCRVAHHPPPTRVLLNQANPHKGNLYVAQLMWPHCTHAGTQARGYQPGAQLIFGWLSTTKSPTAVQNLKANRAEHCVSYVPDMYPTQPLARPALNAAVSGRPWCVSDPFFGWSELAQAQFSLRLRQHTQGRSVIAKPVSEASAQLAHAGFRLKARSQAHPSARYLAHMFRMPTFRCRF